MFLQRFAVDAQRRGRTGFQALEADFDATGIAVAIFAASMRAIDSSIFLISLRSRSRLRSSSAMSDSWLARSFGSAKYGGFVLHGVHRTFDVLAQFILQRRQDVAESA
jgi:hypothetical protein